MRRSDHFHLGNAAGHDRRQKVNAIFVIDIRHVITIGCECRLTVEFRLNSVTQKNVRIDQVVSTTICHQGWIGLVRSIAEIVDRIRIGIRVAFTDEGQVILHFTIRNGDTSTLTGLQNWIGRAETPA